MRAAPVPLRAPDGLSALAVRLGEALRPEFARTIIRVDPDGPVFGRGRCSVPDCERTAWSRLLCMAHYNRWHHAGKPADIEAFASTTGPIRTRAGSVDAFDLSRLRPQARAEVAYVLQCRHDDRAIRIPPTVVSHLIALMAGSGCESLLDRPVQHWIEAVRAKGHRDPSRTIGLVRYAHRRLADLATDHDVEAEYAADTWAAARLGLVVIRPPRSIRFDAITQPWLRAATKRFARHRLGSGKAFGSVSLDVRAVRRFAAYLARTRPHARDESAVTRELLEGYLGWMAGVRLAAHTRNTDLTACGASSRPPVAIVGCPALAPRPPSTPTNSGGVPTVCPASSLSTSWPSWSGRRTWHGYPIPPADTWWWC